MLHLVIGHPFRSFNFSILNTNYSIDMEEYHDTSLTRRVTHSGDCFSKKFLFFIHSNFLLQVTRQTWNFPTPEGSHIQPCGSPAVSPYQPGINDRKHRPTPYKSQRLNSTMACHSKQKKMKTQQFFRNILGRNELSRHFDFGLHF
jgi:hypothetical protein